MLSWHKLEKSSIPISSFVLIATAEERAQAEEAKALAAAAEERRKRDEEEAAKPKGMFQKLFGLK